MYRVKNSIVGNRYGRLIVTARAGSDSTRAALWKCRCDCGNEIIARGTNLRRGATRSCGCLAMETLRHWAGISSVTHGETNTRLYEVWAAMKQRCGNPNNKDYPRYGGRGIAVCTEWQDFSPFREWALASGYDEAAGRGACTIDRIDNNGSYSPDNCRWVSMTVQANNRNRRQHYGRSQENRSA